MATTGVAVSAMSSTAQPRFGTHASLTSHRYLKNSRSFSAHCRINQLIVCGQHLAQRYMQYHVSSCRLSSCGLTFIIYFACKETEEQDELGSYPMTHS